LSDRKNKGKERKEKEEYLAPLILRIVAKRSDMDHSFTCKCMPCLRKRSLDGATRKSGSRHLIAAYYSFIDPVGIKGWVGLVGWPTADGSLPT